MMKMWTEYSGHEVEIVGTKKKIDNTIYSFDIETTSFIELDENIYPAIRYDIMNNDERQKCTFHTCMYIWMLSVNDDVYYGRTWKEFVCFLDKIEKNCSEHKIIYVHNLAFEFQYLYSVVEFSSVLARKKRKVMKADLLEYNIEFRCTYFLTNQPLKNLPIMYNLPVQKLVGDLDYSLIRTPDTTLTEAELGYCENDCLVVYHYIRKELVEYGSVDKIPLTNTGHVRRDLHSVIDHDEKYKYTVKKSINTNPHVYNLLVELFAGGYTHANWIYADSILKKVDSYDMTSSYPYIMTTHKFPSTEFKKCNINSINQISKRLAYIFVVQLSHVKCKYFNNFLSQNKPRKIIGGRYDNGRIIQADFIEIALNDVDLCYLLNCYSVDSIEFVESYFSKYDFLPKQLILFILEKYVKKTEYKGIEEMSIQYADEKSRFNAIYGMCVCNNIRDEVIFSVKGEEPWFERKLTNSEIVNDLIKEKQRAFLSFAWGCWVTSYGRKNIIKNVVDNDEFNAYSDTDSLKLVPGYSKEKIEKYNKSVLNRIENVCALLDIPKDKYMPTDIKGIQHPLGILEFEKTYDNFITQGAKKYATKINEKIEITVAGVPKRGSCALKSLEDFKDNFIFPYSCTGKNTLVYIDEQQPVQIKDYQGNLFKVTDKTGCCLIPASYTLGKAIEYANLLNEQSSARAIYKE